MTHYLREQSQTMDFKNRLRYLLLCCCTLSIALLTQAPQAIAQTGTQNSSAQISMGEEFALGKGTSRAVDGIIGEIGSNAYALFHYSTLETTYALAKFDADGNLEKVQPIALGEKREARKLKYAKVFSNRLFLFTSWMDNSSKKTYYYLEEHDAATLEPIGTRTEILALQESSHNDNWHLEISNNGEYLAVAIEQVDIKKFVALLDPEPFNAAGTKLYFKVYDSKMQAQYTSSHNSTYTERHFNVMQMHVSDRGELFFLSREYEKIKSKSIAEVRGGKKFYHYWLLHIKNKAGNINRTKLELEGKFMRNIGWSSAGEVVALSGTYANVYGGFGKAYSNGIYVAHYNTTTTKVQSSKVIPYSYDWLSAGLDGEDALNINVSEIEQPQFDNILFADIALFADGQGVAFLRVTNTTPTDGNAAEDYILCGFSATGERTWSNRIDVTQKSVELHSIVLQADRCYLFYQNLIAAHTEGVSSAFEYTTIATSGIVQSAELHRPKKEGFEVQPQLALQLTKTNLCGIAWIPAGLSITGAELDRLKLVRIVVD